MRFLIFYDLVQTIAEGLLCVNQSFCTLEAYYRFSVFRSLILERFSAEISAQSSDCVPSYAERGLDRNARKDSLIGSAIEGI